MTLSILIATLPERAAYLEKMLAMIGTHEQVEILTDHRPRTVPTGTKRNDLIQQATGEWFVFVDDDDVIDPEYVTLILEALKQNPDVVTFQGWYTENGGNRLDWTIKLGERYEARVQDGKYQIFRWPNHLSVMRKSLVAHIKFPDIWHGEDYQWSKRIAELGILKTEIHIPKQLYHYVYIHGK